MSCDGCEEVPEEWMINHMGTGEVQALCSQCFAFAGHFLGQAMGIIPPDPDPAAGTPAKRARSRKSVPAIAGTNGASDAEQSAEANAEHASGETAGPG